MRARGQPSIFDDRLEVEGPGRLPFGLTVEDLPHGVSRLHNRVIGLVFHALGLIEQWGSGIQPMAAACRAAGLAAPVFEELATRFRATVASAAGGLGIPQEGEGMRARVVGTMVLLSGLVLLPCANASEPLEENESWTIEPAISLVVYGGHGNVIWGHRFGFVKTTRACDQDVLWISWSGDEKAMLAFQGRDVTFALRIDGKPLEVVLSLSSVGKPTRLFAIGSFTNGAAGAGLLALLKQGKTLEVFVTRPKGLVEGLDFSADFFDLDGFPEARRKARAVCEEMKSAPRALAGADATTAPGTAMRSSGRCAGGAPRRRRIRRPPLRRAG